MTAVDDELLSAFLDGELEGREALAVEELIRAEEPWRRRLEAFRADSDALRALPEPKLAPQTRDVVYRAVTESFAMGAERRRVPRYKRRWMLLAAFAVPCLLTLVYLQNPTHDSRLYFKGDRLLPRAGRTGEKSEIASVREWKSSMLWGELERQGGHSLSFQLDNPQQGPAGSQAVVARLLYDFDGDGKTDREDQYEPAVLDSRAGWQRFTPTLLSSSAELQDFRGGTVTARLRVEGGREKVELSGVPAELVLPYRGLSAEPR